MINIYKTAHSPVLIEALKYKRYPTKLILMVQTNNQIKVITKLPNSEQSYKGKVQTNNYINRQNQSTTGKL